MASTIPIDELKKHSNNIYEAIMIIAKRARQINDEQKRLIEQETGYDSSLDNVNDDDTDDDSAEAPEERQTQPVKYIKLPKPTTLALEEMLSGRLNYHYAEKSSDDEPRK
ncbi:MAG: DNA-directed RNA polymerase subunit omega [candidate division KSB1 bacterium]|nr:DNA-directed RNA polymerase subunit omega [candidate division KSB1 bacterium]MDZ7365736.1 DNA-directed RNA polymerase subunit omega [candidate division KSB1 bacterium]MDZ7403784.1 DNA-directed RNA polymerase subunit omega [candidate division KSB1 bacterium]